MKWRSTSNIAYFTVFSVLFVTFLIHQIAFSSFSLKPGRIQGESTNLSTSRWHVPQLKPRGKPTQPITCNRGNNRYDLCTLNGPTLLDPTTNTAYLVDPTLPLLKPQKVRPYPRKWENDTMSLITELTLLSAPTFYDVTCDIQHYAPALIFSTGGFTGNLFHDFSDGFIPLFITAHSVFAKANAEPDTDPVLVVVNCRDWWLTKYAKLLRQFSRYPVVNLGVDTKTSHCFPSATIGLISHGFMTIDSGLMPRSENLVSFRSFLSSAYEPKSLNMKDCEKDYRWRASQPRPRPRLVLVARTGDVGRVIMNQAKVVELAETLGFEVTIFEPTRYTDLVEAYRMMNRSHAMVGVHGAALTHALFLRPGAGFVQVVPIGVDWLAEACFGKAARDMGLEYIEYKIDANESSLAQKYGAESLVLRDPAMVTNESFSNTKNTYLKIQDITLDLRRFGTYLSEAYWKAKRFMDKEDSLV